MFSPYLIIGVGGAGGKTIRAMKQSLKRQLFEHGYAGELPAAWQFLQIDTTYDGLDFPAPMLPRSEFHQVVEQGQNFSDVVDNLTQLGDQAILQEMLAGWAERASFVPVAHGSGAIRSIGRQVGINDAPGILHSLNVAISKMQTPTALAELQQVANQFDSNFVESRLRAIIVSSLAGGTGSSLFMDVAELLKRAASDYWASEAISFLYTADVFESLGEAGTHLMKNTYGSMMEISSGKVNGLSKSTLELLRNLGIANSPVDTDSRFGCKTNFLIGSGNSTYMTTLDETFLNIGESLAMTILDSEINEFLYKLALVNVMDRKMAVDGTGLSPESSMAFPFAGVGFGRLSVGTDRMADYVADAMTRRQIQTLLWPELNPELLSQEQTREELITEKAHELWVHFLQNSGLNARGGQSQVLDELFPENFNQFSRSFVSQLVKSGFSETPQDSQEVAKYLWAKFESGLDDELEQHYSAARQNSQTWRSTIQKKVANQVSYELSMNGFSVSIALLDHLEQEIMERGVPLLKRERLDAENAIRGFSRETWVHRFAAITEGKPKLSISDVDVMTSTAKLFSQVMTMKFNSYLNYLAESLMGEFVRGYLHPLRESLLNARFELEREWNSDFSPEGQVIPNKQLPEWGSGKVPMKYKSSALERTLIPAHDFESTFNDLARKDLKSEYPFNKSVGRSLLGLNAETPENSIDNQDLLTVTSGWVPNVREAQDFAELAATPVFSVNTRIFAMSEKNRIWIRNPKSSFGASLDVSIREYVEANGDPEKQVKREDQFVDAYRALLELSKPLMKLNNLALNHLRGVDGSPANGILAKVSKIPFSPDSTTGRKCLELLARNGYVSQETFESWFYSESTSSSLNAISVTQTSLPAWAFSNLTNPINRYTDWMKSASIWKSQSQTFRCRPLIESIPFETEIRRSMITGWFIARLFNMVEVQESKLGTNVAIWNPNLTEPNWSGFPSPIFESLEEDSRRGLALPSVLFSSGLAFAKFGESGDAKHLHAYQLLKFVGREVTASYQVARDTWDDRGLGDTMPNQKTGRSTFIMDWIDTGICPSSSGEPDSLLITDSSDAANRKTAFIEAVAKVKANFEELWSEVEELPWDQVPHTWELREDINLAFEDILTYVQGLLNPRDIAPLI